MRSGKCVPAFRRCQRGGNLLSKVMRRVSCFIFCIGLAGCFPVRPQAPVAPVVARPNKRATAVAAAPVVVAPLAPVREPAAPVAAPQATASEISGIFFEGVAFDSRGHRLIVAEQPAGPGTRWADAGAAATAHAGVAAINAGFFTPEGQPLGKVVAGGRAAGSWNRASALGSGVWLEATDGTPAIRRREAVPATVAARELLQAGPMLVEDHQLVSGLEATKSSVRSVILWDGGSRWWIGRASSCTLAALGRALASAAPAAWPVAGALNLDGGRSADLSITAAIAGGPVTRRAPWNRPVRNFLVLVAR